MTYAEDVIERLGKNILAVDSQCDDPSLLRYYALLVLTTGEDTTLENVHDAWSLWRMVTQPDHRSIIWFDQLTPETQEYDRKYAEAIRKTARELREEGLTH